MTSAIRDAAAADKAAVWPLWSDCLRLHGAAPDPAVFARTWGRALAGDRMGLRVASDRGEVQGFAFHFWLYNSWTGREEGCLDTLFVAEGARGAGLGAALIADLLDLAAARRWGSVFWHVGSGNAAARALYDRLAAPDGYLRYRVPLASA